MMNVIPPDNVDDILVVEPNQHGDVLVVPEAVLVGEDVDPKEEEFEEEEEPQEEDDMEVDIEEDENMPELTYPLEEVDPLNPPLSASGSEPKDVTEAKNSIKHEDETVPTSVYEVGESSTAPFLREDNDGLLPGLIRRDINSLFGNEVCSSVEQGTATMEKLVERLGNAGDKTRVQAHEFYQEMIHRRFVFEEIPNEAIDVLVKDEERTLKESQEESS
nr:hypothetical protein [Tanacetum cinerariifolium]